ncbi:hypothetical protein Tco_0601186 [Tanacetum coccineum]
MSMGNLKKVYGLGKTKQKLTTQSYGETDTSVLENPKLYARNPVEKVLLKLNLSDYRSVLKEPEINTKVMMPHSRRVEFIATCSYSTKKYKDMMKAQLPSSIRCAPFEALYGRKCKSPVLWAEFRESNFIGLQLVQETTDKVVVIKEKLQAVRDRQKSYADNRRKPLEFEVGDRVLLKVLPWNGVIHFRKRGKLGARYVGPFKILERISPVAYRLRLPEELSGVHDTFHVSNVKKCLADASLHVPLDEIKVDKTLRFVKEPVEIMDREVKSLKRSRILLMKVCWNSKRGPEFT